MGPLKKYDVEVNGARTAMWLNDADAELLGITAADDEETVPPVVKERAVANKARRPRNKSGA